ncbi:TY-Chap domain-containing protein [Nocardia tengchongensis]|uniref:TY-Chap domain-containing protein n=2 Tax=Nocardia tengchongensis TaxID=2055889 RepID=UPI00368234A9
MTQDWTELLKTLPYFLEPDVTDAGDIVYASAYCQLRDPETGYLVDFTSEDKGLTVTVPVPADPVVAARTLAVIHAQPADMWRKHGEPSWPDSVEEWYTGWRYFSCDPATAASVVAVMRDGLGMEPQRLRCRAWDSKGPIAFQPIGHSDKPTDRGMGGPCTDWAEFAERLDWVLHTLPPATVQLMVPASEGYPFVWFSHSTFCRFFWGSGNYDPAGLGPEEFNRRMRALGLELDTARFGSGDWCSTAEYRAEYKPLLDGVAEGAIAVLRDIYGVGNPNELTVQAFGNIQGIDDLPYVARQLGIPEADA